MIGLHQVAGEVFEQFALPRLIHQCHQALFHVHLFQFFIDHLDFGVYQRSPYAIYLVLFHAYFAHVLNQPTIILINRGNNSAPCAVPKVVV